MWHMLLPLFGILPMIVAVVSIFLTAAGCAALVILWIMTDRKNKREGKPPPKKFLLAIPCIVLALVALGILWWIVSFIWFIISVIVSFVRDVF